MSESKSSAVLQVGIGGFDVSCPICKQPYVVLHFDPERTTTDKEPATIRSKGAERDWLIATHGGAGVAFSEVRARLSGSCVWTRGVFFGWLAEPCLMRAASIAQKALSGLAPNDALTLVSCIAARALETHADSCRHALVIDGHLCATLTLVAPNPSPLPHAGLLNVAELSRDFAETPLCVPDLLPVDSQLLEAAPDEPALSLEELAALTDWETVTCERPRQPRPWQHLILVSHQWNSPTCPGEKRDLEAIQKLVEDYVNDKLRQLRETPDARIKATSPKDFGVWIDFMMVPNDLRHGGRATDCEDCLRLKDKAIKRINALLTLATVLKYNANTKRGWILQELSLNAHVDPTNAKELSHRDRAGLMLSKVEFTDEADGIRLRCYEFLRLGQTPRVWPAVNVELLERWRTEGQDDEGSSDAWRTLTGHARSFAFPCHRLKRLMAELTQTLALARPDAVIDLCELTVAIEEQSRAMEQLAQRLAAKDAAGAPSDPEGVLGVDRGAADRIVVTRALQYRQFVAVGMGLRAEWRIGAGLACWVSLTVLTEALTAAKFMGRLEGGQVIASPARSNVALLGQGGPRELFAFARTVARDGVADAALRMAFTAFE